MYGRLTRAVVATAVVVHVVLLAYAAAQQSPTYDETAYLPAGVSHWEFGRFTLCRGNPPLVRVVGAMPVWLLRPKRDWRNYSELPGHRADFAVGRDFIEANGVRTFRLYAVGRWACISFSVVGMLVCCAWSRRLYGPRAAAFVAILWCFSPSLLAAGSTIAPDMGAATFGMAAGYAFWRWLREGTWEWMVGTGLLLGLAQLTKMTWVILFALWPLMWMFWKISGREVEKSKSRREGVANPHPSKLSLQPAETDSPSAAQLAVILLLGVYIINLGYGFEGAFTKLGDYKFVSRTLTGHSEDAVGGPLGNRFRGTWLGEIPVPLPENYLLGIDMNKGVFESDRPGYLGGEFRVGGWWYYYLYALAVKVPVGTWLLLFVAIGLTASRSIGSRGMWAAEDRGSLMEDGRGTSSAWRDTFVLLAPAVAILVFVSANPGINRHMRYALPMFPFVLIWISQVARVFGKRVESPGSRVESEVAESTHRSYWTYPFWLRAVVAGALVWSVTSSLLVYPHSGSYFNELAGGPMNGWKHLNTSNIDWGQDLLFLKDWLDDHPEARPLKLVYHGNCDPQVAGIQFELPPRAPSGYLPPTARENERRTANSFGSRVSAVGTRPAESVGPVPGWHAVSAQMLAGSPGQVWQGDATPRHASMYDYSYFQEFEPVARAGYSIYIYHVKLDEVNRLRRRMGLPDLVGGEW